MVIGIDHGFYAIKGVHVVFPSGLSVYDYEPYTMQNVLQYEEKYYVCGTGRQALLSSVDSSEAVSQVNMPTCTFGDSSISLDK